jgi:hypothetical protein
MLPLPTIGRSDLGTDDLDATHLALINDAILHGKSEHILVSSGVRRLMAASGAFGWLPAHRAAGDVLPRIYEHDGKTIYLHLHFSNYGKFEKRMLAEAAAIKALLPSVTPDKALERRDG